MGRKQLISVHMLTGKALRTEAPNKPDGGLLGKENVRRNLKEPNRPGDGHVFRTKNTHGPTKNRAPW